MSDNLRKCQLLQLDIAKEVKRLCDENDIKYFLNAGTLLGAIRHDGFIPWDDDMDIGMLRADYEKFLNVAKEKLNKKYFLQTWDTDEKFALPFAKIRLNGTKYIEHNSKNVDIHNGIYIDIFPYDNVSDDIKGYKKQKLISKIFIHLLLNKSGYEYVNEDSTIKKLVCIFLKMISRFLSYDCLHKGLNNCMGKYNSRETNSVVTFGGASSFEKETLLKSWLENTVEHKFEDTDFSVPEKWQEYLTHFYGDYMTPPPIEQRYIGHSIVDCDFGDIDNILEQRDNLENN
jgi:lipopolysaccharide cholinephosphotransferase